MKTKELFTWKNIGIATVAGITAYFITNKFFTKKDLVPVKPKKQKTKRSGGGGGGFSVPTAPDAETKTTEEETSNGNLASLTDEIQATEAEAAISSPETTAPSNEDPFTTKPLEGEAELEIEPTNVVASREEESALRFVGDKEKFVSTSFANAQSNI